MKVGVGWERVHVPRSEGYVNKTAKSATEIGGKVQIEAQLQIRQPKNLAFGKPDSPSFSRFCACSPRICHGI